MSTEFMNLLPPTAAVGGYNAELPPDQQITTDSAAAAAGSKAKPVPALFTEAMSVRHSVFVREQSVPAANEFDKDDARSFHWVVYASVSSVGRLPVGTIRLVPPPHPPPTFAGEPHPQVGEPYVKLGRLSTLKQYRGLGLGRLLIRAVLEWAGEHATQVMPYESAASREAIAAGVISSSSATGGGAGGAQNISRPTDLVAFQGTNVGSMHGRWNGLILVHAQTRVKGIWARRGFELDESMGSWVEEGLEHVGMWRRIRVKHDERLVR